VGRSYFDFLKGDGIKAGLCGEALPIAAIDPSEMFADEGADDLCGSAPPVDVGELVEIPLKEEDLVPCELLGAFHHALGSLRLINSRTLPVITRPSYLHLWALGQ
jgi:hypothetical protein